MALALAACGNSSTDSTASAPTKPENVRFPSGKLPDEIVIKELQEGSGPPAGKGDKLKVKFLAVGKNGKVRYSSWDKKGISAAVFRLGQGKYFPGWDKGIEGMKVGGRREIFFPAKVTEKLGPLLYVVDLVSIE